MTLALLWRSDRIARLMAENGIHRRRQLAERLEAAYGIGKNTVYRNFTETWEGNASSLVLAAISEMFRKPLSFLVTDPSERGST